MIAFYAGGDVYTGHPADAPKEGVLVIVYGRKKILYNFEHYYFDPALDVWGGCYCDCAAQRHREKGRFVFEGELVSDSEFQDALEKARELSHTY